MDKRRLMTSRTATVIASAALAIDIGALLGAFALIAATISRGRGASVDFFTVGGLALGVSFGFAGWFIATRRPDNAIGWVFLVIGLTQAIDVFASMAALYGLVIVPGSIPYAAEWSWVAAWAWAPGFTLLVTLCVQLFPDGRPVSRGWRPLAWISLIVVILMVAGAAIAAWPHRGIELVTAALITAEGKLDTAQEFQSYLFLLVPVLALASIASMVVRFRRAPSIERQQLRWFAYAAIPVIGFLVLSAFVTLPSLLGMAAAGLIAPLLPVAAGVAILRYHLYDLDRIVSRTVAYGLVLGLLGVVFLVVVFGLQALLAPITSGQTVPVAASTLAVLALSQPVYRRVRRAVDQRFDRARYDAELTAEAFAARLRDETNLEAVTYDLTTTTHAALAPATLSIWLRR